MEALDWNEAFIYKGIKRKRRSKSESQEVPILISCWRKRSERGLLGKRTTKETHQERGDSINSTESQ